MVTPVDRGGFGEARLRSGRIPLVFVSLWLWVFAVGGFVQLDDTPR